MVKGTTELQLKEGRYTSQKIHLLKLTLETEFYINSISGNITKQGLGMGVILKQT